MDEQNATRDDERGQTPDEEGAEVEGHQLRGQTREGVREDFDASREEPDVEAHQLRGQLRGGVREDPGRDM